MKKSIDISLGRLYDRASKRAEVAELQHNIFELYYLSRHTYEMRRLLKHYKLTSEEKIGMIETLPGFKKSQTFSELLYLLLENESVHKIYQIHESFNKYVNEKDNAIIVQVFTAIVLSDTLQVRLSQKLEKTLGKKVILMSFVDERLIGGIVFKLPGGKVYNFSLDKALTDFKFRLLED